MQFTPHQLYHIYNRGNDQQLIYFKRENYLYFLQKLRKFILPHCEMLAYCLMPNHFHLLVYVDERIIIQQENYNIGRNLLSEGFRHLLSSYTKGINNQENRTGHLFTQNTKAKWVECYGLDCLHYIHLNPLKAGLVANIGEWEFSSYRDYAGIRKGTLCNQQLAAQLFDFGKEQMVKVRDISEHLLKFIY